MSVKRLWHSIRWLHRVRITSVRHHHEHDGGVRMPDQTIGRLEMREVQRGDKGIKNIFPNWLTRAAMRQRIGAKYKRSGQRVQVGNVFWLERFLGPVDGFSRICVKCANVKSSKSSPVVVPGEA